MKKIITSICLGIMVMGSSQVIIGGKAGTASDKTSVLLDFEYYEPSVANPSIPSNIPQNKGIVLPYVRTMSASPTTAVEPGTILVDASNASAAAVKYYAPGNSAAVNGWVDLSSGNTANLTTTLSKQPTTAQVTELANARAIIGATSSGAIGGVLVLESATKAMVLPQVAMTDDIINPAPGMMVYVNGVPPSFNKRLAVFNGSKWTYWAP